MSIPSQDKCGFCADYERMRKTAVKNEKTAITFWCVLRIKAFPWKKKTQRTPLYTMTMKEYRLHFCPRCGKQLIGCRQD